MCSIEAHDRMHPTEYCDASSGGGRPLPYELKKYVLLSLGLTLNFADSWLQLFKNFFLCLTSVYGDKMSELFKNIPVTISGPKSRYYKNKIKMFLTNIGGNGK